MKITEVGLNHSSAKWIEPNSVIVAMYGATAGKIAINKIPLTTNQACCNLTIDEKIADYNFVYYYLYDSYAELENLASGAAQQNLNVGIISDFPISLPPLAEQRAIAGVLSSLDDKIDLLHRENQTLEQIAETLFRQWFVEEASEDWDEVPLGNSSLATIIKSGIHYFEGEKIYLETGDVDNTEIKGGKPVTYKNRPSRANMEPLPYSVWFAKKGGVRKLLMFDDYAFNINDLILSTGFTGLKTTKLSHYYLWCYLLSSEFQDIKDNFISGSVQPDINNESLLQIMVLKPENETLIKFNQIVENYFHKISINRKQISVLERLRDTLLPKLMSGEVRVTLTEEKA